MIGDLIEDRYLVEELLGEGAMGRVYLARHVKVGRKVALKVMHRDLARVPTILERFAREAWLAAKVRHPALVAVLDVGMTPQREPLIVLELAPGESLSALAREPMAPSRVIGLVGSLLRGLEHAHAAGLIHRDLKPDNIRVEQLPDGREVPRIVDFGIALSTNADDPIGSHRLTDAATPIGTPYYMSPEQVLAKDLDGRTDLFALGVIVYELLAGRLPFEGETSAIMMANLTLDPPPIAERAGVDVDPLLEAFARRLMARDITQRFQTAREALRVLELVERDRPAAALELGVADDLAALAVDTGGAVATAAVGVNSASHDDLDDEIPRPRRRRWPAFAALATATIAAAALAMPLMTSSERATTLASVSIATIEHSPVTERESATEASAPVPTASEALAPHSTRVAAPSLARATSAAVRPRGITPRRVAAVPPDREKASPIAAPEAAPPAAAAIAPVSADAVVARYVAVGEALRGCTATDSQWQRYRLIRLSTALSSAAARQQALGVLDDIERTLR